MGPAFVRPHYPKSFAPPGRFLGAGHVPGPRCALARGYLLLPLLGQFITVPCSQALAKRCLGTHLHAKLQLRSPDRMAWGSRPPASEGPRSGREMGDTAERCHQRGWRSSLGLALAFAAEDVGAPRVFLVPKLERSGAWEHTCTRSSSFAAPTAWPRVAGLLPVTGRGAAGRWVTPQSDVTSERVSARPPAVPESGGPALPACGRRALWRRIAQPLFSLVPKFRP